MMLRLCSWRVSQHPYIFQGRLEVKTKSITKYYEIQILNSMRYLILRRNISIHYIKTYTISLCVGMVDKSLDVLQAVSS